MSIRAIFDSASLFSFSIEIVAPECTIQLSYLEKWLVNWGGGGVHSCVVA